MDILLNEEPFNSYHLDCGLIFFKDLFDLFESQSYREGGTERAFQAVGSLPQLSQWPGQGQSEAGR